MDIPGERFDLPLDAFDTAADDALPPRLPSIGLSFISDIVEKPITNAPTPPSATNTSGFPAHKKRIPRGPSRFKQQQQQEEDTRTERQRISDDNEARIAAMDPEEIERERRELLEKLDPKMVQMLLSRAKLEEPGEQEAKPKKPKKEEPLLDVQKQLRRANLEEPGSDADHVRPRATARGRTEEPFPAPSQKKVSFTEPFDPDDSAPPFEKAIFDQPAFHFPTAPAPPQLDPSDPNFLQSLHEKYFPELPADPSKLAWMTPIPDDSEANTYNPADTTTVPSQLRFDFRGDLLPPSKAQELPVTLGLHHHADAPNAAGYTIPELARLARSTVNSQRCIAMQVLGRMLYKLGTGVYRVREIEEGLWRVVRDGRVIETLEEAAGAKTVAVGVKSYATEALWLWQKGGGQRPEAIHAAE